jgi:hypothetical protein
LAASSAWVVATHPSRLLPPQPVLAKPARISVGFAAGGGTDTRWFILVVALLLDPAAVLLLLAATKEGRK